MDAAEANDIVSAVRQGNNIVFTKEDGTTSSVEIPQGLTEEQIQHLIDVAESDDINSVALTGNRLSFTKHGGDVIHIDLPAVSNRVELYENQTPSADTLNKIFIEPLEPSILITHEDQAAAQPAVADWVVFEPPNYVNELYTPPDPATAAANSYYFDLQRHGLFRLSSNFITNTNTWVHANWTELIRNAVFLGDSYDAIESALGDIPTDADTSAHTYLAIVRTTDDTISQTHPTHPQRTR